MLIQKGKMKDFPVINLDLDGFVADFIRGSMAKHKITDLSVKDCRWDYWKQRGISDSQFWEIIKGERFWHDLEPMHDGIETIRLIRSVIPLKNLCILSSANHYGACEGKRTWIKKYLPDLVGTETFCHEKWRHAGPNKVLIDDSQENLENWANHGGIAITVPRPWNDCSHMCDDEGYFDPRTLANIIIRKYIELEGKDKTV